MGWHYLRNVQLLTEHLQDEEWWLPILAAPVFVEVGVSAKPANT